MVQAQQLLILLCQGILGFNQNPDQIVTAEALQTGNNGHTAHQLGNNTELQQVIGFHLCQQLTHITLTLALNRSIEANGAALSASLNDPVQAIK